MTRFSVWAAQLPGKSQRFAAWAGRHRRAIRWSAISLFIIAVSIVCAVKFGRFGYNGLDLGIYTQVVWNTAHGHPFAFSIHHQSYLGDHVELGLLFLAPFFRAFPHPLTLLFFQALFLGLAAWPLGRLAERRLGPGWGLAVSLAYLVNPFVVNTALYEFHFLAFALLPLFACLNAYEGRRFGLYLLFFLLSLTVREDVALVLLMFSVLALIDRRSWRWVAPGLLAIAWFAGTMWLTGHLNPNGQYKFLAYYGWLGPNLPAIVKHALLQPWRLVDRLLTFNNLNFAVGMLLPFAFLPALKRRGLILALPIFLQLFLIEDISFVVFRIHYTVLLLPGLFLGFILGLQALTRDAGPPVWARWAQKEGGMAATLLVTVVAYSAAVIGPIVPLARAVRQPAAMAEHVRAERALLSLVPDDAGLATSYALTSAAATRSTLSSLHYVFLGMQQYANAAFTLPQETRWLLIDRRDFVLYHALYREHEGDNDAGNERLRQLAEQGGFGLVEQLGDLMLLERGKGEPATTAAVGALAAANDGRDLGGGLRLLAPAPGATLRPQRRTISGQDFIELPLTFTAASSQRQDKNLLLELSWTDNGRTRAVWTGVVSPFFPTTDWTPSTPVTWSTALLLPHTDAGLEGSLTLTLVREEALPWLDGWGTIVPKTEKRAVLGSVSLGSLAPLELGDR